MSSPELLIQEHIEVLHYKALEDPKNMGLYSEVISEWKHVLGISADVECSEFFIINKVI